MPELQSAGRLRLPSRVLRNLEVPRAASELAAYYATWQAAWFAPRGDGHAVLTLPGLLASDMSTWPLRSFLRRLSYDPQPWLLGRNVGPANAITVGLPRRLHELHERTGRRVSLIGMSLGGVFARDLARSHPDLVRQVITLGSPFRLPGGHSGRRLTHAEGIYRALLRQYGRQDAERSDENDLPPLPVPATAIYTRSDGVVPWRLCLERESPRSESVEVWGSHCGLGHNPLALAVIANRLAQPEDRWRPLRG